jgi:hypothetical protein
MGDIIYLTSENNSIPADVILDSAKDLHSEIIVMAYDEEAGCMCFYTNIDCAKTLNWYADQLKQWALDD